MTHGVRPGPKTTGISYVGDHALPHMARFDGTVMRRFLSASEGGDRPSARRHNDFHVAIHEGPGGYLTVSSYNLGLRDLDGCDGVPNPHQGYLVLASRTSAGLGQALRDCSEMIGDLRRGAAAATSHLSDHDLDRLRDGIMWHEREALVLEMGRAARVA